MYKNSGVGEGWLTATNNNQLSMGARRPKNNNPTQQANDKDLVGRVKKFVPGAAVGEVDAMATGVWCEL